MAAPGRPASPRHINNLKQPFFFFNEKACQLFSFKHSFSSRDGSSWRANCHLSLEQRPHDVKLAVLCLVIFGFIVKKNKQKKTLQKAPNERPSGSGRCVVDHPASHYGNKLLCFWSCLSFCHPLFSSCGSLVLNQSILCVLSRVFLIVSSFCLCCVPCQSRSDHVLFLS